MREQGNLGPPSLEWVFVEAQRKPPGPAYLLPLFLTPQTNSRPTHSQTYPRPHMLSAQFPSVTCPPTNPDFPFLREQRTEHPFEDKESC